MTRSIVGAFPGALLLATIPMAACGSTGAPPSPPPELDVAVAALDLDEPRSAEWQLEPLLSDDADPLDPATRSRVAWMLAQARALRALDVPSGGPVEETERTGLRLGALYFAGLAAAEPVGAGSSADGPTLLRAAQLSALGFDERSTWVLDQVPRIGDRESAEQLLRRCALHPRLEAGVWLALFRDRTRRDARGAFAFAVATLAASDRHRGSLTSDEVRSVEAWIEEGAPFVFRCPECGQPAVPQLRACPNDQTRLERYVATPRP